MDALDQLTLRKRRDRLLNRVTAPHVVLEEAMFVYKPENQLLQGPLASLYTLLPTQHPNEAFDPMSPPYREYLATPVKKEQGLGSVSGLRSPSSDDDVSVVDAEVELRSHAEDDVGTPVVGGGKRLSQRLQLGSVSGRRSSSSKLSVTDDILKMSPSSLGF
jgi:hypothetical protein